MITIVTRSNSGHEEARGGRVGAAVNDRLRPPAVFVYNDGQIMLELLLARAEEEDRRRFITGLRRPDGSGDARDDS
jgi:hypothetical protein